MKTVLFIILILLSAIFPVPAQKNNELLKPERIYLHTDRDVYIAGEYLFYNLYLQGDSGAISKYAYFVLRDHNNSLIASGKLEINNRVAFGNVYLPDTLSSGIYQIVCYTNCMRSEDEDKYFNKEIVIANRFDEELNAFAEPFNSAPSDTSYDVLSSQSVGNENLIIHLDKHVYSPREKITFSIESSNIPANSVAHLSVSVSEIVPGIPPDPSISEYFSVISKKTNTSDSKQKHYSFNSEVNEAVLQGRVLPSQQFSNTEDSVNKNATSKHYTILVSTPDSVVNMQYAKTDSLGSFRFFLNRFYDGKELFIRLKENVDATIVLDNKFNLIKPFEPSGKFNVHGIKAFLIRSGIIVLVQRNYNKQNVIDTLKKFLPANTIPRVYYKHYASVLPSDFVELKDFDEISKEIVPGLRVRKSNSSFISTFVNIRSSNQGNEEPEIFLDGVPIDYVNQIISLGSSQIRRIETLPVTRYYGEMSFAGILAVFSNGLFINNIQFKRPTLKCFALSSQPYTKPDPFKPAGIVKHIPDLRQVLLWEPGIIMDKSNEQHVECYASDLHGKYRINVEGITSGGDPVNGSAIITIKSKSN